VQCALFSDGSIAMFNDADVSVTMQAIEDRFGMFLLTETSLYPRRLGRLAYGFRMSGLVVRPLTGAGRASSVTVNGLNDKPRHPESLCKAAARRFPNTNTRPKTQILK
jgi:hypothetical protein